MAADRLHKNAINLAGNKYGRLAVVSPTSGREDRHIIWLCQCDCGKKVLVPSNRLRSGNTKSCGCLHSEIASQTMIEKYGYKKFEATVHRIYKIYQRAAKKRAHKWALPYDVFEILITENCHYCGGEPNKIYDQTHKFNGTLLTNGVDRKNNNDGYTIENCVPCCETCNKAKLTMGYDEFINWVKKAARHQSKCLYCKEE